MPLISVIIPTFNRADLLRRAIDSVLAQTCRDFEVIVVDDGSSDETPRVMADYGERIRAYRQANAGPGAARNLGIENARGEYCCFLDSDDLWFPWTVDSYKCVIDRHDHPPVIVSTIHTFQDEQELLGVAASALKLEPFADVLSYFEQREPIVLYNATLAIQTEKLREVQGFRPRRMNSEDTDLMLRLGLAGPMMRWSNPPACAVRLHGESLTYAHDLSYSGLSQIIEWERNGEYPGGPSRAKARRAFITFLVRATTLGLLRSGRYRMAWDLYRRCLKWHIRLGRWPYLCGFPLVMAWRAMGFR